jgi:hypothetical protein
LRTELLERYSDSIFNDTERPFGGEVLVAFLRDHAQAIIGLDVLDEAIFAALPDRFLDRSPAARRLDTRDDRRRRGRAHEAVCVSRSTRRAAASSTKR